MAKNENKTENKPVKESEVTAAPEKITESTAAIFETALHRKQEEKLPKPEPHKGPKPEKPEPPHHKHHGWRKFVFFIFLCLLGCVAFLAISLQQTKEQNAAALQKLQAAYDEKVNAVAVKINILEREVAALKDRPIVEQVAGVSENQLNQKIAAVRDEFEYRLAQFAEKNPNVAEANESESAAVKGENEPKSETLPEQRRILLEPQIASLAATEKKTQEVLLASGAIIVRDLAEQGGSFAYEAEVLQILARGNELAENYVRTVRMFANVGVLGKNQLIRNFDKVFAELNNSQTKIDMAEKSEADAAKKWYEKALVWLKQSIVVKKGQERPVFTAQNDEVYELVHEGRFQDALNAMKTSEKYAKVDSKPLNEWYLQVSRYIQFNNAVSGLIMNALANIHLKELEHAVQ
ncbi:MAG: hypothetical protein IJ770_04315 [Alphaproteobacteria bacterium]|nr:hypothetical protein [Alphaproteobacteria bacterium]